MTKNKGGALKVDEYIQGSSGKAEDVVGEIGFAIYRTQEMADLIDWMRSYNETASADKKLHFYGMDAQRYDNNKEYLFSLLYKMLMCHKVTHKNLINSHSHYSKNITVQHFPNNDVFDL